MLSHHASSTPTSWDFWFEKCYARPLKSLLKIVQRNANFNFKLWNRLRIKKSNVDLQEKQLWLEKKVLSCPNLCLKPFFAVNWYYNIFVHSFVLLAFFSPVGHLLSSWWSVNGQLSRKVTNHIALLSVPWALFSSRVFIWPALQTLSGSSCKMLQTTV